MEMTVKEVLIAARAKIADPANWTKNVLARNIIGDVVPPESSHATCWCAVGAIEFVCGERYDDFASGYQYLEKVIGGRIPRFNDTHTHAEVLAKFDEAIAAQGGE